MAGNIPPLVSSSPPPLSAFDDDEDDEDEFGMYTTAEEIDYNECITYKEKDGGAQSEVEVKSRGEQDSTSQDSATDSGLCPDSEGVSPTPHSDDERTARQSVCDRLCQKPPVLASELPVSPIVNHESESSQCPDPPPAELVLKSCADITNGHVEIGDHYTPTGSDDEFGNFENFECPSNLQLPVREEDVVSNKSESDLRPSEVKESNGLEDTREETVDVEILKNDFSSPVLELKESEEISFQNGESDLDHKVDFQHEFPQPPLDEKDSGDQLGNQQERQDEKNISSVVKTVIESEHPQEGEQAEFEEGEDEFDDFTDFKANFSNSLDLPETQQSSKFNEHSKPFSEPEHLEEAATSLQPPEQDESDDEFSNFADFSSSDCAFVSAQSSNSLENVSHIPLRPSDDSDLRTESDFQDWVSAFPCESSDAVSDGDGDGRAALLKADDGIWMRLFPLESSPALSYQWAESLANRHLLSALNIDSRNILFMPWSNSTVPRFAANLSCGLLQPVKATEPPPQPAPTPAFPPSSLQESVPDAHFDWVGSGLTNPLDCPKPVLSLPKTLSVEAESLLASLPDLSFMRKTYIDFPINEG